MIEKYCDINYRGYLLEIEKDEYLPGRLRYKGSSRDTTYFSQGIYSYPHHPINIFISAVDETLGEREKEEELLICTVVYKRYELKIWLKEDLSYMAWIDNFDFASWGENWSIEKLAFIIEAFRVGRPPLRRNKVDRRAEEDLINTITDYKGHRLVVKKKKDSNKYIGISTLLDGKWRGEGFTTDFIVKHFKYSVEKLIEETKMGNELTYEEVCYEWGSNCKKITYKNQVMWVTVIRRAKGKKVFYLGYIGYIGIFSYKTENDYWSKRKSIESIHYDKVISKFERFVDECCTDWQARASFQYNGFDIQINQEKDKEFYLGIVQFHKNSTFKHIDIPLRKRTDGS